ncbi:Structural maintenance of chromosomes protein 3, partial [Globisporangium splendens]
MHIKQVIVCGFRSYKDQVAIEPFSKEHNVVIGRNGTGKSNFFDAIRFGLLTARFANLRPEERQALLHEGSGKHMMSAYVEIVFDNRDGRLPVDTEEVVLRRTIGVKKDEFFLNRKHITKSDVIHLLESAGFSRSNPYYIVQQGKVNALALMKEKERLELLKEVAGTKVYEERRLESLKIVQETQSRREKIQEVIKYIEERLAELEEEKEELREYQQLDRDQRALEYTMHEKELQSVRADLEAIERTRMEEAATSTELHEKQIRIHREISRIESNKAAKEEEFVLLLEEKKSIESERKGLMEARYQLELEVKELEEQVRADGVKHQVLSRELKVVSREIEVKQRQLEDEVLPAFNAAEKEHERVSRTLHDCIRQSDELIAKQSRKSQFKTQQERDAYLQKEIREIDNVIRRKEDDAAALMQSIDSLSRSIIDGERQIQQQSDGLADHRQVVDACGSQLLRLKETRNALSEERKEKWRLENQMAYDVRKLTEQLNRGESVLQSTMPYDVRRGLQAVREMSERGRFSGIYGPLIELVEPVDERFCTATDEAAGGSLFHVVVDTDDTAAKIMRELEKKNMGRITFLPLNRLKIKDNIEYPKNDDVIPLIDKLRFPSEVRKGVLTAFGKKLLCRDLDTCVRYAEQTNMDCLTLDGDMVHRRGALNGGFKDPQRSRMKAMMDVRRAQRELDGVRGQAKKIKFEAQQADQRVASVVGEIQKQEAEKQHAISVYERLFEEISRLKAQVEVEKANYRDKQRSLESQEREVQDLVAKVKSLRSELSTPMRDTLSDAEMDSLHSLSTKISKLQTEERAHKIALDELLSKKEGIETVLNQNLVKRQRELSRQLGEEGVEELAVSERDENLKAKMLDLDNASRIVDENSASLKDVEQKIAKLQEDMANEKALVESLHTENGSLNDQLQQEARRSEKVLNRRRRLLQKREDAMRDIRELGTLPITELEKFKALQFRDVIKEFNKRNEKLKDYSHVNKKALDQYVSFNEQRTTLLERKRELDEGYNSIKDLIDVLDKRKDEAILRTFKGVSHHFSEVFRELVPTGEGKMLIIRADSNQSERSSTSDGGFQESTNVDTFSGVQIKVSFRGEGDSYLMQQLSGGQKALVALAFIFAIQRCDPAPFYLFDEIDQALDSTHRASVAALIHRQAHSGDNSAQFITSTFRPELVSVADKFYGIGYQNKISNVYPMTKQESLDFIGNIMAEEEEVERTNK